MSTSWIFTLFFPVIGTLCSNAMYCSSTLVVRLSRRQRFLGKSINPVPWAFGAITSITWFIYGAMISDFYIVTANALGVVISIFSCSTAFILLGAAREEIELKYAATMESVLIVGVLIWIILAYSMVSTGDNNLSLFLVGSLGTCSSISMYLAPMSSVSTVFRLKDSSSIYLPQVIACSTNAVCWTIYGFFGVNDLFVWVPNFIGILSCVFLLTLRFIFPAKVKVMLGKAEPVLKVSKPSSNGESLTASAATNEDLDYPVSPLNDKYRGRLASMDQAPPVEARNMVMLDQLGSLVRVASTRQVRVGTLEGSVEGPVPVLTRGRSATVQAALEIQTGESLPVIPSTFSRIQGVVEGAVEGLRVRAESVLLQVEDTVVSAFEPLLAVEVVEAVANLEALYQADSVERGDLEQGGSTGELSTVGGFVRGGASGGCEEISAVGALNNPILNHEASVESSMDERKENGEN